MSTIYEASKSVAKWEPVANMLFPDSKATSEIFLIKVREAKKAETDAAASAKKSSKDAWKKDLLAERRAKEAAEAAARETAATEPAPATAPATAPTPPSAFARRKSEGCRSGSPRAGGDRACRREGPCPRLCRGKECRFGAVQRLESPVGHALAGSRAAPHRGTSRRGGRWEPIHRGPNGYFFASLRGLGIGR